MTNKTNNKVILWAVDPDYMAEDKSPVTKMLRDWSERLKCRVQPISVLSAEALKVMPLDIDIISSYLQGSFPADFNTPDVIVVRGTSQRKMAFHLARYARKKKASYIFVQSRNKKETWNPFRLGGFAEALLAYSLVPVVVLNAESEVADLGAPILFPTNFKKSSLPALRQAIAIARDGQAPIHLFNQIESFPKLLSEVYLHKMKREPLRDIIDDIKIAREKKAHRWASHLKQIGISAEFDSRNKEGSLAEDIIQEAERIHAGLIVMASEGRPLPPSLIGSTIRNVIAMTKSPVLVINLPKESQAVPRIHAPTQMHPQ